MSERHVEPELRRSTTELDGISMLSVPIPGDAVAGPAVLALHDLRSRLIPAAFRGQRHPGCTSGKTAETADDFDAVTRPTA